MTLKQKYLIRVSQVLTLLAALWLGMRLVQTPQISGGSSTDQSNVSAPRVADDSDSAMCTATVNVRLLNQRSGPGITYNITGNASRGEVFTAREWDETYQWLGATMGDSSVWMYAPYLTLQGACSSLPISGVMPSTAVPETAVIVPPVTLTPQPTTQPTRSSTETTVSASPLSVIFTPQIQYWAAEISEWAADYQLDPNLIATVMQIESCGDPSIHSTAGAQGLFQVMPFHFTAGEDMLDVQTNARRGLNYLKGALDLAQGNAGLALVGYNGGYGAIRGNWAAETQRYYYWGSGIYMDATAGVTVSATLQSWLAAGGNTLCARAELSQQLLA